eukprot:jgi/Ulvmu1/6605/UM003_0242.1
MSADIPPSCHVRNIVQAAIRNVMEAQGSDAYVLHAIPAEGTTACSREVHSPNLQLTVQRTGHCPKTQPQIQASPDSDRDLQMISHHDGWLCGVAAFAASEWARMDEGDICARIEGTCNSVVAALTTLAALRDLDCGAHREKADAVKRWLQGTMPADDFELAAAWTTSEALCESPPMSNAARLSRRDEHDAACVLANLNPARCIGATVTGTPDKERAPGHVATTPADKPHKALFGDTRIQDTALANAAEEAPCSAQELMCHASQACVKADDTAPISECGLGRGRGGRGRGRGGRGRGGRGPGRGNSKRRADLPPPMPTRQKARLVPEASKGDSATVTDTAADDVRAAASVKGGNKPASPHGCTECPADSTAVGLADVGTPSKASGQQNSDDQAMLLRSGQHARRKRHNPSAAGGALSTPAACAEGRVMTQGSGAGASCSHSSRELPPGSGRSRDTCGRPSGVDVKVVRFSLAPRHAEARSASPGDPLELKTKVTLVPEEDLHLLMPIDDDDRFAWGEDALLDFWMEDAAADAAVDAAAAEVCDAMLARHPKGGHTKAKVTKVDRSGGCDSNGGKWQREAEADRGAEDNAESGGDSRGTAALGMELDMDHGRLSRQCSVAGGCGAREERQSRTGAVAAERGSEAAPDGTGDGGAAAADAQQKPQKKNKGGAWVKKAKTALVRKAELHKIGSLWADTENGWFTPGYIFPEGYCASTSYRSSANPSETVAHECSIVGRGGVYWPRPTFVVVAADRPHEPLVARSCTGVWKMVQERLNEEVRLRLQAGEKMQGPSRQALSGPVYFGLTMPSVIAAIEALDPDHTCKAYWATQHGENTAQHDKAGVEEKVAVEDTEEAPVESPGMVLRRPLRPKAAAVAGLGAAVKKAKPGAKAGGATAGGGARGGTAAARGGADKAAKAGGGAAARGGAAKGGRPSKRKLEEVELAAAIAAVAAAGSSADESDTDTADSDFVHKAAPAVGRAAGRPGTRGSFAGAHDPERSRAAPAASAHGGKRVSSTASGQDTKRARRV